MIHFTLRADSPQRDDTEHSRAQSLSNYLHSVEVLTAAQELAYKRLMFLWGLVLVGSLQCTYHVDSFDIPRIQAESEADAWGCVGYLHGRDRIYPMEFMRLATQGRLSESYGLKRLKTDVFFRMIDLTGMARRINRELSPESRVLFEAYVRGVNAGMRAPSDSGVSNFRHLVNQPEPWTVEDSIAAVLLQSFFQTKRGLQSDVTADKVIDRYKAKAMGLLNDRVRPWYTSVIKANEVGATKADQSTKLDLPALKNLDDVLEPLKNLGIASAGSNNFVVSGSRTSSGFPILANDPHLELKDPPFWYWVGIETPNQNILAATVPGTPSTPLGVNDDVAWGLTNSFFDMTNLVVMEKAATKLTSERPWIYIDFSLFKLPFFFKSVERTEAGWPLVPLERAAPQKNEIVALYWSGYELIAKDFETVFKLPRARSVAELDATIKNMRVPSWHFVFADRSGKIAYRMNGLAPRYESAPPLGFQHRNSFELLTQNEMPSLMNPSRGYIVTANNSPWPAGYKFSSGNAQEPSFRAWRIEELIKEKSPLSLESAGQIQCDTLMIDSKFLKPKLIALVRGDQNLSKEVREFLTALETTDLYADRECRLCGVYQLWIERLRRRTDLEESALYGFLNANEFPESKMFAKEALLEAHRILWNRSEKNWRPWSEIHKNQFWPMDGIARPETFTMETVGSEHSVNLGQAQWQDDEKYFKQDYGPSSRFVVEMSSPPKIRLDFPGANRRSMDLPISEDKFAKQWATCGFNEIPLKSAPEVTVASREATAIRIR